MLSSSIHIYQRIRNIVHPHKRKKKPMHLTSCEAFIKRSVVDCIAMRESVTSIGSPSYTIIFFIKITVMYTTSLYIYTNSIRNNAQQ